MLIDCLLADNSGGPVVTAQSAVAVGRSVSQVYAAVQTASHFPMTSPRSWSACALALLLTEQTQSMHQTYIQTNIKSMVMHQYTYKQTSIQQAASDQLSTSSPSGSHSEYSFTCDWSKSTGHCLKILSFRLLL